MPQSLHLMCDGPQPRYNQSETRHLFQVKGEMRDPSQSGARPKHPRHQQQKKGAMVLVHVATNVQNVEGDCVMEGVSDVALIAGNAKIGDAGWLRAKCWQHLDTQHVLPYLQYPSELGPPMTPGIKPRVRQQLPSMRQDLKTLPQDLDHVRIVRNGCLNTTWKTARVCRMNIGLEPRDSVSLRSMDNL